MKEEPAIHLGVPMMEMRSVAIGSLRDSGVRVAAGVDWTVQSGDFWVVAGSQRSGKTDFLMTAGGLMPPEEGTYQFCGLHMPIFEDEQLPERLRMGLVFDGGQLFNRLTVGENVSLPLRYHRNLAPEAALEEVQPLLEALELERTVQNRPMTLGRGFQTRVGLARALALQPEVLLLDNPLSGLDAHHTNWWLNLLDGLARGNELTNGRPLTMVVTTDDLRPWRGEDRKFACLAGGRLLVLGGWENVERNTEPAVQILLRERRSGNIDRQT